MKLPLSWLKSFVDIDLDVDDLVDVMSMRGLEVEAVTRPGAGVAGVRTARVLEFGPHPDADKLRVVRVTGDGGDGEIEVVCGAANFDVGDVVVHALPGGAVPGMQLEARDIRGVVSNGMLCSPRELELGDDHSGIIVLDDSVPLGVDLAELVPVGEPVIEIAVQADRGDHLSIAGVARDLAAILDTSWRLPEVPEPVAGPTVDVDLDTARCASFATWALDDVVVGTSPLWMRQRLAQCGVRSIDVVVDVTNYVMLELGQPLHAFDLACIEGGRLRVREARGGERLTTLDDVDRELAAGDLVIDDDAHPVSLAGVMGGRDSEVSATTSSVLIEAAVWDPLAIRATSRRLGLVSEASIRFERRVDPGGAERAAARAADLLIELAGATARGTGLAFPESPPRWATQSTLDLDPGRVRALLGIGDLDDVAQQRLLERSGCVVEQHDGTLRVTTPTWRGDLGRAADLVEEAARLHGYEAIPARLPDVRTRGGLSPTQRLERDVREAVSAAGFHEAQTRPFVGQRVQCGVVPTDGRVLLANPLAQDAAAMRPTLLEGLLVAVRHNVGQGRPGTALAEFGRIFRPAGDPLGEHLDRIAHDWRWLGPEGEALPVQPRAVGLVAQGVVSGDGWLDLDRGWSVYDLLAVIDEIVRRLTPGRATQGLQREAVEREGFHPGRTVRLLLDGVEIGVVGQLHPEVADERDLPEPVVLGELLLEALLARVPNAGHAPVAAPRLVRHPAMTVDVALVAPDDVSYATLEQIVIAGAGDLLDGWWQFDEYRGEQVGEGSRSVGIRLRLQDPDRQLTDSDGERVIGQIASAAEEVGARLRR